MCGIAGIRKFGDQPIRREQVRLLALAIENRGKDATGFALVKPNGDCEIWKEPVPAWEAVTSEGWRQWIDRELTPDIEMVLVHDRAATQGHVDKRENNHPLFNGKTCVTHNGVIHNDGILFSDLKLTRKAEVDSDIIRAILDEEGLTKDGIKTLRKLRGSLAIAATSTAFPRKLLLARSGNPIVVGSTPEYLYWASEKDAIHLASRQWIWRFKILMHEQKSPCAFTTMPDHTAWLLGPEGVEWHDEMKVAVNFVPKCYDSTGDWVAHQKRWGHEPRALEVIICPNPDCGRACSVPDKLKDKKPWELICTRCKTRLGEKPE